jgi:competence protein ComEA
MSLAKRQIEGVVALAVIATLAYAFNLLAPILLPFKPPSLPFSRTEYGQVAVALNIDGTDRGVYFMPKGSTVSDLILAARNDLPPLESGGKIFLTSHHHPAVIVGKMSAKESLALDLPMDINTASLDELILVSGIGEKTAEKIIALREEKGKIHDLNELMEIKGIKEKRLAALKKYLSAEPH